LSYLTRLYITTEAATTAQSQVTSGAPFPEATTSDNSSGGASDAIDVAAINQSTTQGMRYTERANLAMHNNDTQDASRNLNLALNGLENVQGNLTLAAAENGGETNIDSNTPTETEKEV
jgi:hypothetical protein